MSKTYMKRYEVQLLDSDNEALVVANFKTRLEMLNWFKKVNNVYSRVMFFELSYNYDDETHSVSVNSHELTAEELVGE